MPEAQLSAESRERNATDAQNGTTIAVTFGFPFGGLTSPSKPAGGALKNGGKATAGGKNTGKNKKPIGGNGSKPRPITVEPINPTLKKKKNVFVRVGRWLFGKKNKPLKEEPFDKTTLPTDEDGPE